MKASTASSLVLSFAALGLAQSTNVTVWPYQTFESVNYNPPQLAIAKSNTSLAKGLLVLAPQVTSTTALTEKEPSVPLLMNDAGELVWNGPEEVVANLQVQTYNNKKVLTYYTGVLNTQGHGYGSVLIFDDTYTPITTICPHFPIVTSNGSAPACGADFHESLITDRNTILVTAVNITAADLSPLGGPTNGYIFDTMFYELNITTGEVLFNWSPFKAGIPLNTTHAPIQNVGNSTANPFDWFHMNAVSRVGDKYFVNGRHTWQ